MIALNPKSDQAGEKRPDIGRNAAGEKVSGEVKAAEVAKEEEGGRERARKTVFGEVEEFEVRLP